MVIQPLSTRLIKPNFCFDLSHRRSTTVSLETRNSLFFLLVCCAVLISNFTLNDVCGINVFAIVATCLFPVKTDKKEDRRKREIKEQERRVIVSFIYIFLFSVILANLFSPFLEHFLCHKLKFVIPRYSRCTNRKTLNAELSIKIGESRIFPAYEIDVGNEKNCKEVPFFRSYDANFLPMNTLMLETIMTTL